MTVGFRDKGGRVLDVGAGEGAVTATFAHLFDDVSCGPPRWSSHASGSLLGGMHGGVHAVGLAALVARLPLCSNHGHHSSGGPLATMMIPPIDLTVLAHRSVLHIRLIR